MRIASFDPSLWPQIDTYLDRALDLEPRERHSWLVELTTTQPEIARILRQLLAEREVLNDNGFLQQSPLDPTALAALPDASVTGTQIGAYTIDRLIGRGGMGEVWLASRSDGRFEGRCAIKLVDSSAARPKLADRFHREGRLLARLGHPNIARLLDAGATEEGRQFLVLEYVDGERIDHYCEFNRLPVAARVRLFLDAVSAVAHAHSHLIIHRDLKPSNVLVTRDGAVKLLDFGIAKLLDAEQTPADGTMTHVEELALTPEYAAPEQLLGEVPSTATDVYQLGMLLYVLLSGGHPLQLSGSRAERIKAALDGRVPRASEFARGALSKALRGDLDAILAMALHTDPTRRYPTAAALREELVRYLSREPVSARRGTRLYQARKFVARHRVAVAGSAAAIVSLCATLVFALGQARVAAVERDRAMALASRHAAVMELVGMVLMEAAEADQPVTVTNLLERSERLALADTHDNPENRAAVLEMIAARYVSFGEFGRGAQLLERALALIANSHDSALRSRLSCGHALAIASLGHAGTAVHTLAHELDNVRWDPESAAYCSLYRSFIAANDRDGENAQRYATEALEHLHAAPRTTAIDEGLFLGAVGYGYDLNGRIRDADHYYRLALEKYTDLGREGSPGANSVRNNWASLADGAGAPQRALQLYEEILSVMTKRNPGARPRASLVGNRAHALESIGRYSEARAAYELELELARQQQDGTGQVHSLAGLASVAEELQDGVTAAKYLEQLTAAMGPALPPDKPPGKARAIIQGRLDIDAGKFDAARRQFALALGNTDSSSQGIAARLGKAEAELLAGDAAAAADDAQRALNAAISLQDGSPYSNKTGLSWLMLGRAQQQLGDSAQAGKAFEAAVRHLSNTVDRNHPALVRARDLASATPSAQTGR